MNAAIDRRQRLALLLDLARITHGGNRRTLARMLGRDATNLVSTSALPKLDLAAHLAAALGWPLDEVARALIGGQPEPTRDGPTKATSHAVASPCPANWFSNWFSTGRSREAIDWHLHGARSICLTDTEGGAERNRLLALAAAHEVHGELDLSDALGSRLLGLPDAQAARGAAAPRGAGGGRATRGTDEALTATVARGIARLVWRRRAQRRRSAVAAVAPVITGAPAAPAATGTLPTTTPANAVERTRLEGLMGRPFALLLTMDDAVEEWWRRVGAAPEARPRGSTASTGLIASESTRQLLLAIRGDALALREPVGAENRRVPHRRPSRVVRSPPTRAAAGSRVSLAKDPAMQNAKGDADHHRTSAAWSGAWTLEWVLGIGDVGGGVLPGRSASATVAHGRSSRLGRNDTIDTIDRLDEFDGFNGSGMAPTSAILFDRDLERLLHHTAALFIAALFSFATERGESEFDWPLLDLAMRLECARRRRVDAWTGPPTPWELSDLETQVLVGLMGRFPAWRSDGWTVLKEVGAW